MPNAVVPVRPVCFGFLFHASTPYGSCDVNPVIVPASIPCGNRRRRPTGRRERILPLALMPELLSNFAPLDLLAQFLRDLQPGGLQGVIASFGMDVRAGHSQMHLRAKGRSTVTLTFKHHVGGGDGYEATQALEL